MRKPRAMDARRRQRRLLLLLSFAAFLSVATLSLPSSSSSDRPGLTAEHTPPAVTPPSISTLDLRSLDASSALHAAAKQASDSGRRVLASLSASAPAKRRSTPEQCPPSVALTGAELREQGNLVKLPCGLTLGSHLTLVGAPRARARGEGASSQFVVELRGAKAADGDESARVLHFNARLHGDWSGRPVIEQNTRFREQWGAAVRCEGWRSRADEETVDGLVKCEQWIRSDYSMSEELKRMWWSNRLIGRTNKASIVWPFPFVEGRLFVLTLSIGLEGYLVYVDGRHVTSFPYHVGFVLEDATVLSIDGDLDIESVFAGSLPALYPSFEQDDMEMLMELKAPPLPQGSIELFIGILSAGNHFAERMAVRRSWMSAVRNSSNAMARFFVALHGRNEVNEDLKKEADFFGDVVIVPFIDSYDLVVLKTLAICEFAVNAISARYVMKCDDDTFVRVDSVLAEARKVPDGKSFYLGNINYYHKPLRGGKWAVTQEEWPGEDYPPYANGPAYFVSSDIASFVVSEFDKSRLKLFKMEDVSMGMWVGQFNSSKAVEYIQSSKFCQFGCVDGYYTAHYQSPEQMVCLWEKLEKGKPQCCGMR